MKEEGSGQSFIAWGVPGLNLKSVSRNGSGPVMIAVKDSSLAIGRGIAEKVIVEYFFILGIR